MKQNLRRILMCAALAGLPFLRVKALDWVPVGDGVDSQGFATTGGVYHNNDYISENDSPNPTFNQPDVESNPNIQGAIINVYPTLYTNAPSLGGTEQPSGTPCTLKINDNVAIEAITRNVTINLKKSAITPSAKIVFEPYFNPPAGGLPESNIAQLYFNTAAGKTITINGTNSVEFTGKTVGNGGELNGFRDLLVTFAGQGQVIFNADGDTSIVFTGQIDKTAPAKIDPATGLFTLTSLPSTDAGGCKVFVTMQQTKADINAGKNKVVFQRNLTGTGATVLDKDIVVGVGYNSVFTYLSNNLTGLVEPGASGGYGAAAFDISNPGNIGRLVLIIRGAYHIKGATAETEAMCRSIDEKYPFNDGAVVIAGHYVPDFDAETISGAKVTGEFPVSNPGYEFDVPAGIEAIMRVVDNQAYAKATLPYLTTKNTRRGLLVINDVQSHGKLASDPYWDLYTKGITGFEGNEFAYSNPANEFRNVRLGFVLGVNGLLDMYHNTFMDYAAGSVNQVDLLAAHDFEASVIKQRNPSAFLIDGLDVALFVSGNPYVLVGEPALPGISAFQAADPYVGNEIVKGTIQLRGDATLYLKESASSATGYICNIWGVGIDPFDEPTLDYTQLLALDHEATYNGQVLTGNEDVAADNVEGMHVFDAEGYGTVESISNLTTKNANGAGRRYAGPNSGLVENAGVVTMACLLLNYKGQEIYQDDSELTRPLLFKDGTSKTLYTRYNSPAMYLNRNVDFFNSTLVHADATKLVTKTPSNPANTNLNSAPAYTGGEVMFFANTEWPASTAENVEADPDRYRFPEIQLYNSEFAIQESAALSGMRLVVKDDPFDRTVPSTGGVASSNESVIRFFDHGIPLDSVETGYGRILLCGTSQNLMSDGNPNEVTESCYVNVFRRNPVPSASEGQATSTVKLSLQNGDQFTPAVQAIVDVNPAAANRQRAHHLFLFSQPDTVTNPAGFVISAECNMNIGWGAGDVDPASLDPAERAGGTVLKNDAKAGKLAPFGDAAIFPFSYPYVGEPIVANPAFFGSMPFSLDALTVPPAILSVDGNVMCFGSFDSAGEQRLIPVIKNNESGAVYVNHGGKIQVTNDKNIRAIVPAGDLLAGAPVISARAVVNTIIAKRLWNDYEKGSVTPEVMLSGIIDMPQDQTVFESGFAVQAHNLTQAMFNARRTQTDGFVRMSFLNDPHHDDPVLNPNPGMNTAVSTVADRSGAGEVLIGWFDREAPEVPTVPVISGTNNLPSKSRKPFKLSPAMEWLLRSIESNDTPVTRPTDILLIGADDDIRQMRVSGATMSDPFMLDVSGDATGLSVGRVREFVSQQTTNNQITDFIGEGAHAILFVEHGGRIGLGSRAWNSLSVDAWNVLGKDYITVAPLGDGVVDLNANLLVNDRQAILPTQDFSANQVNALTFFSIEPYEVRVPAGQELDLSGFGQAKYQQIIRFSGNVKLVFEPGATLRLPYTPTGAGLILEFTDNAQLIFEGTVPPSQFAPFSSNRDPIQNARIKIVGQGTIQLNKTAQMRVDNNVFVAVQTDPYSQTTDCVISIQDQAGFVLGDGNQRGGSFEVGDPIATSLGEGEAATNTINFSLVLDGTQATFKMNRGAFFGLGAGIINKGLLPNGNPARGGASRENNPVIVNGQVLTLSRLSDRVIVPEFRPSQTPDTSGAWQVQALNNVSSITIKLSHGEFQDSNIADGSSEQASVMAIGPAGSYEIALDGVGYAALRGGGNLMCVPGTATMDAPITVNVWDYAGPMLNGEAYSVLASGPLVIDRSRDFATDVTNFGGNGKAFTFNGANAFKAAFNLLGSKVFETQRSKKTVISGTTLGTAGVFVQSQGTKYATIPMGAQINRTQNPPANIAGGSIISAVSIGALGATADQTGNLIGYVVID